MRHLRRMTLGLLCAASALAACNQPAPEAEHEVGAIQQGLDKYDSKGRVRVRVLEHNLAGGLGMSGSGKKWNNGTGVDANGIPGGLAALYSQIEAFNPDVVMLVEVCEAQHAKLKQKYGNWDVYYYKQASSHANCANKGKGHVLMSKHGLGARNTKNLSGDIDGKDFGILCAGVKKASYKNRVYACVTHFRAGMDDANIAARREQTKEAAAYVKNMSSQDLVLFGGDLNVGPSGMTELYTVPAVEGDQSDSRFFPSGCSGPECRSGEGTKLDEATLAVGAKLDYVFGTENRATGRVTMSVRTSATSDHRILRFEAFADVDSLNGGMSRCVPGTACPELSGPIDPEDDPEPPAAAWCGDNNDCWRAALGFYSYGFPSNSNPNDPRLARIVFDRKFYLNSYDDVRSWAEGKVATQGGNLYDHAEWHWLNYGVPQGRMGSATFDPIRYMNTYPDLVAAFGWNNYHAAIQHFINYGRFEGRRASPFFDPGYYRNAYGDLAGMANVSLLDHFTNYGMDEGRRASYDFAPAWYMGLNPDVQVSQGYNNYRGGMIHWRKHGNPEGRLAAPELRMDWIVSDVLQPNPYQYLPLWSFGQDSYKPVVGDWDGDGIDTAGYFRNGWWYLSNNFGGTQHYAFQFGQAGDLPVVGDWDGDGVDTVGVYQNGLWIMTNNWAGASTYYVHYNVYFGGAAGDVPVTGDWDGLYGTTGIGIYRYSPGASTWFMSNSLPWNASAPLHYQNYYGGAAGDVPMTGNWDGIGGDGIGIYRGGHVHLANSLPWNSWAPTFLDYPFGLASDKPVVGDWNGDGSDTIGVAR